MEIFAIDCGNKQTKMSSSFKFENQEDVLIYPSRFIRKKHCPEQATFLESKRCTSEFLLSSSKDIYVWGKDVNTIKSDKFLETITFTKRHLSDNFKKLFTFALGQLAKDYEQAKKGILEVLVVTGIPTNDFNEETANELKKLFIGDHNIQIDGNSLNVRITDVKVIDQPIGTIYDLILDDKGYVANEKYLEESSVVIDIGGGTILVDTLKGIEVDRSMSDGTDLGVHSLYDEIQNDCLNHNIDKLNPYQIESLIREGLTKDKFLLTKNKHEVIDISNIVEEDIKIFTEQVIDFVNKTIKKRDTIDNFIFTGGGSNIVLIDDIEKNFKYIEIVSDSEIANVRGFLKFGYAYLLD